MKNIIIILCLVIGLVYYYETKPKEKTLEEKCQDIENKLRNQEQLYNTIIDNNKIDSIK